MRQSSPGRRRLGTLVALAAATVAVAGVAAASPAAAADGNVFSVHNLVSDGAIAADHTDPNLVNSWGIVAGPTTPWWVADNGTDVSTLYDGSGIAQPPANPLVVNVEGGPTGIVFNGNSSHFIINDGNGHSGPARFLFATESGTIRGWSPAVPPPPLSTDSFVAVDRSDVGAIYKGLAIASTGLGDFLYATDFHNGRVDMFTSDFRRVPFPFAFLDPSIPSGYAPFGIRAIGNRVFVTYAKQDADRKDDVHGPGLGFVDQFSLFGVFLGRVASHGQLNAPWGIALAPAGFGNFGGDLLIGNFGDGRITAYKPSGPFTFRPFSSVGQLEDRDGNPIAIDGLWGISFGNGAAAGPTSTLFFAAGPNDEQDGLFGSIEDGTP